MITLGKISNIYQANPSKHKSMLGHHLQKTNEFINISQAWIFHGLGLKSPTY
jgi:hypothetical protein